MIYQRISPDNELAAFVDCFWIVEDDDCTPIVQKIIPDGYAEIIFHYKAPYKINISGSWQRQEKSLLAGQIKKHFFLQNTGSSGVFGIKFKPPALSHLLGISMSLYTDKVVPISTFDIADLTSWNSSMQSATCMGRKDGDIHALY